MITVLYVPHFIDLKPTVVEKPQLLMICVRVTSSAKGHSTLRKAYKCISLLHTHMHMALCMHTCSCIQLCLPPRPLPPPPPPYSSRMPQSMYAKVPRCMPIALGLIHNTMPFHIRTSFSKSLVNVWVRCMYVRVYVRVTNGRLRLSTCERMYRYIYACAQCIIHWVATTGSVHCPCCFSSEPMHIKPSSNMVLLMLNDILGQKTICTRDTEGLYVRAT